MSAMMMQARLEHSFGMLEACLKARKQWDAGAHKEVTSGIYARNHDLWELKK